MAGQGFEVLSKGGVTVCRTVQAGPDVLFTATETPVSFRIRIIRCLRDGCCRPA